MSTSGGCTPASSRWNPTKEQVSLLESLYKQGIRTPSTEQIEQITSRLRVYGHIEGKNVFYWFQNHKARQRQKQKQESLDCFNRCYLHQPSPVFAPNVVCSPYFIPRRELGFRPNKLVLPGGVIQTNPMNDGIEYCNSEVVDKDDSGSKQKTLTLFPLEPTGTSRSRTINVGNKESSRGSSTLV